MRRDRRGSTHSGQPASVPLAVYEPPPEVISTATGLTVAFRGEDGRSKVFTVGELPSPGWHASLAAAFAQRVGPAGTRRTLASAASSWTILQRLVRFLDGVPHAPATPAMLTAAQVDAYMRHRVRVVGPWAWEELTDVRLLLRQPALREHLGPAVLNYLARRVDKRRKLPGESGYSDGELTRLVSAARTEVAAVRDRIEAGERLLAAWSANPATVAGQDRMLAAELAAMAESGLVPRLPGMMASAERQARIALAQHLFVTRTDREPTLVLLAALTGRNCETLKELPAEPRILDGVAVELRLIKRRHGPRRWFDTVSWEIGPPHRELHTPGGLYLLLHRLMTRSRSWSGSRSLWSVWCNAKQELGGVHEHRDPFAATLNAGLDLTRWARGHDLRADPPPGQPEGAPLPVKVTRIRTSVEVRRTRATGGHLPSAARSNTVAVLFANYLRGDATARAWAEDVLGDAVADAEQAALAVHRDTLAATGHRSLRIGPAPPDTPAHEGAWTACTDPQAHPATGRPCRRVSYLDCFHCGNCLITRTHLPAILALVDELADRRTRFGDTEWWQRYGPVWAAIRRDVLPKFTPAELATARISEPLEALLELAEDPWEHP